MITDRERGCLVWLQGALAGGSVTEIPVQMCEPMITLIRRGYATYSMGCGAEITHRGEEALK